MRCRRAGLPQLCAAAAAAHAAAARVDVPFGAAGGVLSIEVASASAFRLGVRFGAAYAPGAIDSLMLDPARSPAPAARVAWGGMAGLQTAFGALLAAPDGTWALYDAANATLVAGDAPPALAGGGGAPASDAGVMLPVAGVAALGGRGRACLGNGLFAPPYYYNQAAGYLALAVSGWQFDPLYPHCYPAAFSGAIGGAPIAPAVAAAAAAGQVAQCPGTQLTSTDAAGGVRSQRFPDGVTLTTGADGCCAACASDPSCVAWVWGDASHPDPTGTNCWPLQAYAGTQENFGRIFGGPPAVQADAWWAMGLGADWYLAPAATPHDYTRALYQLTGPPAVPPRYAMGFMATYWGYTRMEEVEGNMTAFRDGAFPIDSFIMDYDWWNTQGNDDLDFGYDPVMFGNHTFAHASNSSVPNATTHGPVELFAHFHADLHMRFGGIRKPRTYSNVALCNASGWLLPDSYTVGAGVNNWNMSLPGKADWAAWYEAGHQHFVKDGLDFWWNDEGETLFNTYSWWNKVQADTSEAVLPGRRFWTLNRAFQPGMQRWPAVTWTGDRQDCSHATVLTFTVAGQPYTACDMTAPGPTVLVRQYWNAVFLPIMRVHAMHGTPRFPFLWGGPEHQAAFRAALNTRYAFLPHLYSLAWAAHSQLVPMVQPASYVFMGDLGFPAAVGDVTYLVSDTLLPADVSTSRVPDPNENTTHVNVPPGAWYRFNTTAVVQGPVLNLTYTDVPLDELVLFVRAGSILTLQRDAVQYTDALGGALQVHVYAGRNGSFTLVEDDGATTAYLTSPAAATRQTQWAWDDAARRLTWSVAGTFTGANVYTSVTALLFEPGAAGPASQGPVPLGGPGTIQF